MKYCSKCKVNVNHQLNNCPICGAYLDEHFDNDNCEIYKDMDSVVESPILHESTQVPFFKHKFNLLLLTIAVMSVIVNLLFTPSTYWSFYVATTALFGIFAVMSPINNKSKLVKLIFRIIPMITLYAIALELGICKWHYKWFTAEYVLPFIYAGWIIVIDLLVIFRRNQNKQLFSALIFCTMFALCPQIGFWIASIWNVKSATLIPMIVFFAAILNVAVVMIVCNRSLKDEMERNLNL